MKFKSTYFLLVLLIVSLRPVHAKQTLSLDLNQASLPEAIRIIAASLKQSVIISPGVFGSASLHLIDVDGEAALDFLLATHDLARWRSDNIWYIAPRMELIQHKTEESKWREAKEEAAALRPMIWQIHYARAEDIAKLVQNDHGSMLSKRGRLHTDNRTNIIYIEDTGERLKEVRALINRLDVPVRQLEIEVRLANVDVDFEQELGINFTTGEQGAENEPLKGSSTYGHYSLAVAKLADHTLLDVKLAALENTGRAELISSPRLFTSNLQTSAIEAGEEVPYQAVSQSGGTAVEFKKAVLGFKVTPQVLPGTQVMLEIQINQDRPSNKMVLGMPTISTRQIKSNVLAESGQTIVLGGIYEIDTEFGEQRLPFISQVPVIGWLFKQRNKRIAKRELLIFVTPKVL